MLEVVELGAGYGRVEVLWDVDIEVGEGEIVALVGSNGAGKTTLLRAISGLIDATEGAISFDGQPIAGLRPEEVVKRGIAHVPEGRHLFSGLTVRENLMAGAFARRDGSDLERALDLFPHLKGRLDQLAASMSGGEQQMCAIARGLMSSPKLVMIDELSLGLAPSIVDQLCDTVRALNRDGLTLLVVEQDVAIALDLARHAFVMDTGRIVGSGEARALANDPA